MDYSGDYSHDYGATAPELTRLRGELIQMNRALRDLQSTSASTLRNRGDKLHLRRT